jgi:hypothetical chaperone protein
MTAAAPNANRVGIGIDFGTTNTAAALFDGTELVLVKLEPDASIMPSATYIDSELKTLTGEDAISRYIADNTGRTVELIAEVVGVSTVLVGDADPEGRRAPETLTKKIYGQPVRDCGLKGRLFRGTKRLLGNKEVRRLMVFDHPFRLVALITPILLHVRRSIEHGGRNVGIAHVGHPVNFEGRDQFRNQLALARLGEAYAHAGIKEHRFYPEPVAAAVSYLHRARGDVGERLLTVDFGGGTLDFSVLRQTQSGFDVIATHGVAIGGDHIDQRLFRELLFPLLGKGETWRRRGIDREIVTQFPFDEYEELLLNWAVTYLLNQNRFTTPVMDCLDQGGPAAIKFRRLRELIKQNYGYLVFQGLKDLKARLSDAEEAVLDIPEIDVELTVSRRHFEELIADLLQQVSKGIDDTLERAALSHDAIDIVLRTGGSSLIPAVKRILEERFPNRVVEHDPFTSVAAGLAIADYYGYSARA